MSTTPLTDAINALTQYANETTGASDTNLSDAVGTLVAGYGGGGGGLTKLATFTANAERSIQIDIDPAWLSYDVLLIVPNITVSAADWIYLVADATSGGGYTSQTTALNQGVITVVWTNAISKQGYTYAMQSKTENQPTVNTSVISNAVTNYLYYYTYNSAKTMTGTMTVYGVSF